MLLLFLHITVNYPLPAHSSIHNHDPDSTNGPAHKHGRRWYPQFSACWNSTWFPWHSKNWILWLDSTGHRLHCRCFPTASFTIIISSFWGKNGYLQNREFCATPICPAIIFTINTSCNMSKWHIPCSNIKQEIFNSKPQSSQKTHYSILQCLVPNLWRCIHPRWPRSHWDLIFRWRNGWCCRWECAGYDFGSWEG